MANRELEAAQTRFQEMQSDIAAKMTELEIQTNEKISKTQLFYQNKLSFSENQTQKLREKIKFLEQ